MFNLTYLMFIPLLIVVIGLVSRLEKNPLFYGLGVLSSCWVMIMLLNSSVGDIVLTSVYGPPKYKLVQYIATSILFTVLVLRIRYVLSEKISRDPDSSLQDRQIIYLMELIAVPLVYSYLLVIVPITVYVESGGLDTRLVSGYIVFVYSIIVMNRNEWFGDFATTGLCTLMLATSFMYGHQYSHVYSDSLVVSSAVLLLLSTYGIHSDNRDTLLLLISSLVMIYFSGLYTSIMLFLLGAYSAIHFKSQPLNHHVIGTCRYSRSILNNYQ